MNELATIKPQSTAGGKKSDEQDQLEHLVPEKQLTRMILLAGVDYLCEEYWRTKSAEHVQRAAFLVSKAEEAPADPEDHDEEADSPVRQLAFAYQAVAICYTSLVMHGDQPSFLADAIRCYLEALARHDSTDPARAQALNNLAGVYSIEFDLGGKLSSLEEAVRRGQEALAMRPPGHPRRAESLFALSQYMGELFKHDPDKEIAEHFLKYGREVLEIAPSEDPNRQMYLHKFATLVFKLEKPMLNEALLEEGVAAEREALDLSPADDNDRIELMNNLASGLDDLFQIRQDVSIIDEAIELYNDILRTMSPCEPLWKTIQNNLANSYNRRYGLTKDIDSLEASLHARQKVLAVSEGHPEQGWTHDSLDVADMDLDRYRRRDIHEIADRLTHADDAVSEGRDWTHHSLGVAHMNRYRRRHLISDLEDGLYHLGEALIFRRREHPQYTETALQLGVSLVLHYNHTDSLPSLYQAVSLFRIVCEDRPETHPSFVSVSAHMASTLMKLAEVDHKPEHLDEAIAICRRARTLVQVDRLDDAAHLVSTFSQALLQKTSSTNDQTTLDEAIELVEEAVALSQGNSDIILRDAIKTLQVRIKRTQDPIDLETVARYTEMLKPLSEASVIQDADVQYMNVLLQGLNIRDDWIRVEKRLAAGIKALSELPPRHPTRYLVCITHALTLLEREYPSFDFLGAMRLFVDAANAPVDSQRAALILIKEMLEAVDCDHDENIHSKNDWRRALLEAYIAAVQLLPKVAYFGLEHQDKLRITVYGRKLATVAAYHATALGESGLALEVLEQGRAIFWSQGLRLRARDVDFSGVPQDIREELGRIFHELDERLSSEDELIDSFTVGSWARGSVTRSRRQSARAQELVDQVRTLPGLDRFLLGPSWDQLSHVAEKGPVVVLLSHAHASQDHEATSEAIAITRPGQAPLRIRLPHVSSQTLSEAIQAIEGSNVAYRSSLEAEPEVARGMFISRANTVSETDKVLAQLWTSIAEPIIEALRLEKRKGRDRPRLTWCPTGLFTSVPLHAAGTKTDTCSDYFVSSYTPTLSALLEARRDIHSIPRSDARILVAAAAKVHGLPPLWAVHAEIEEIRKVVPATSLISLMDDIDPQRDDTFDDVYSRLPEANIVHLACHGVQDFEDLLHSGFALQDGRITMRDLTRLNLDKAFFAFLSACETAKGLSALPEEAFHLCAAMLYTGFRSVIGTMWVMGDVDGPAVSSHFYREIMKKDTIEADDIPYALDSAVQALRKTGLPPNRWATFIHMGA